MQNFLEQLKHTEGAVTIHNGVATFEDGTSFNLRGDNRITIDINTRDDQGNVVVGTTGTTVEMTRNEISEVIDHAAQLILIECAGRRSSGDTNDALRELENALVSTDIIDQIRAIATVKQKYPLANIIEGDGTNSPDIAVLTGDGIDSGLLSKMCYSVEDAWTDAAKRISKI